MCPFGIIAYTYSLPQLYLVLYIFSVRPNLHTWVIGANRLLPPEMYFPFSPRLVQRYHFSGLISAQLNNLKQFLIFNLTLVSTDRWQASSLYIGTRIEGVPTLVPNRLKSRTCLYLFCFCKKPGIVHGNRWKYLKPPWYNSRTRRGARSEHKFDMPEINRVSRVHINKAGTFWNRTLGHLFCFCKKSGIVRGNR